MSDPTTSTQTHLTSRPRWSGHRLRRLRRPHRSRTCASRQRSARSSWARSAYTSSSWVPEAGRRDAPRHRPHAGVRRRGHGADRPRRGILYLVESDEEFPRMYVDPMGGAGGSRARRGVESDSFSGARSPTGDLGFVIQGSAPGGCTHRQQISGRFALHGATPPPPAGRLLLPARPPRHGKTTSIGRRLPRAPLYDLLRSDKHLRLSRDPSVFGRECAELPRGLDRRGRGPAHPGAPRRGPAAHHQRDASASSCRARARAS